MIADLPCENPEVEIVDAIETYDMAPKLYKSKSFQRVSLEKINCSTAVSVTYVCLRVLSLIFFILKYCFA